MQNKERNYYIWAVAGVYLMYLGVRQLIALFGGASSIPALSLAAGLLFLLVGGAVLLREWRAYRRRYFGAERGGEDPDVPPEDPESEEKS